MPDPLLYLRGAGTAAAICFVIVLAVGWLRRSATSRTLNLACLLGISLGLGLGYYAMRMRIAMPPMNALDRFFVIVLPAVIAVEAIAAVPKVPPFCAWAMRCVVAICVGRVLLHGSVYLQGPDNPVVFWPTLATLIAAALLLAGEWFFLHRLSQRVSGFTLPVAMALCIQCAGMSVMLAGYIKGGSAAFPLTAVLIGTAAALSLLSQRAEIPAVIGIGVVGLFGVLFIGRYFGRISTPGALAIFLAPLLSWATEISPLQRQPRWLVETLRIVAVAIPLIIVLVLAKRDFDRHTRPLLGMPVSSVSLIEKR